VSSFDFEQAESMRGGQSETLDELDRLVNTSMVHLEPRSDGSVRYRLLEPLRDFGHERLTERGLLDQQRARHARAMLALIERAGLDLEAGPRRATWFRRMALEWDNVRAALDWAESARDAELALRLCAPLWVYWTRPNRRTESRVRLRAVLAIPGAEAYPLPRA